MWSVCPQLNFNVILQRPLLIRVRKTQNPEIAEHVCASEMTPVAVGTTSHAFDLFHMSSGSPIRSVGGVHTVALCRGSRALSGRKKLLAIYLCPKSGTARGVSLCSGGAASSNNLNGVKVKLSCTYRADAPMHSEPLFSHTQERVRRSELTMRDQLASHHAHNSHNTRLRRFLGGASFSRMQ